ncbi:hypothetical protein FCM35_KLT11094 [Carex littledalei]|uniref:Uncharacterized protein n=1 Tax=Carex littledalei TaxID=544730 RepID=A0A833QMG7_9POAL|nr:hypothetical protein FCM35_KLT11094 [Carex littledalei]
MGIRSFCHFTNYHSCTVFRQFLIPNRNLQTLMILKISDDDDYQDDEDDEDQEVYFTVYGKLKHEFASGTNGQLSVTGNILTVVDTGTASAVVNDPLWVVKEISSQNGYLNEDDLHAIRISRPDLRVNLFTETELAAAELLVQLSESGSNRDSLSSDTSSPRSVNTRQNPIGGDDEEEGMVVLPRRRKRYRMISDLYKSTTTGGGDEEKHNYKKQKRPRVEEEERGVVML